MSASTEQPEESQQAESSELAGETALPDLPDLIVPSRFRGPPSSGNGGWSAGAIAAYVADPWPAVTVSLLAPPPLDVPMTVTRDDAGVVAAHEGRPILSSRRSDEPVTEVPPLTADVARAAESTYAGLTHHPFPTCFACGTGRAVGDGLRIFAGRVADPSPAEPRVAATWTPHPSVAGDDPAYDEGHPRATLPVTWAALDCIGGWSSDLEERPIVLARMTARLDSLPLIGEEHVVVGRLRGEEGRKTWTSATLYAADGRVVASAEHLWIAVDPAAFA